ncbi:MAG: hypothetical protein HRU38_24790 [Saccharospirillaceae bacterium]|nr:hypothetical protein [Pseudomonadales bacterium]NRB81839.1 hypothetical protein [Saccharospirillaceae bacterium]
MKESRDYLEMTFRSIECFSNDGKLDAKELGEILAIAEKDGKIDNNEIRVLRNIISKIKPSEIDSDMKDMLKKVSDKVNA